MRWLQRLARAFRATQDDGSVDAELRLHLEMEAEDLVRQGVSPDEARRRAALAFGGLERFRTEARDVRRGTWLTLVPSELVWAWRGVQRRRLASVVHVGLVAMAIAANALVFAATDAYVFNPTPYPNAERLVVFQRDLGARGGISERAASAEILAWRKHRDLFTAVHAYEHSRAAGTYLEIDGVTEDVPTAVVTPGLFEMLGVLPRWGRPFLPGDEQPDRPSVVVVSEALARRLFDSPAAAVDGTLGSGASAARIVGVMPADFRFPTLGQQIWRPLLLDRPSGAAEILHDTLASIAPGQTADAVARAVSARHAAVAEAAGVTMFRETPTAVALAEARRGPHADLLVLLLGAAGCLLLVACLNVASLALASAIGRAHVYAVQSALGAGPGSLVRVALLEGAMLTTLAAAGALGLSTWTMSAIARWLPAAMRDGLANAIDVDRRVVAFVAVVTVVAWICTSLPVVWRASRPSVVDDLRRDERTTGIGRAHAWSRHVLMAVQVAVTVLLLIGALLFVRSYGERLRDDKGFDSARLANITITPLPRMAGDARPGVETPISGPPSDDVIQRARADTELAAVALARLRLHPRVVSASRVARSLPLTRIDMGSLLEIEDRPEGSGWVNFGGYAADPAYFSTLGIRLLRGRVFRPTDPPNQVVVDEAFAKRFWPAGDALGARFRLYASVIGNIHDYQIIGIAAHVRADTPETPAAVTPFAFYPQLMPDYPAGLPTFVVRLDDERSLAQVTDAVRAVAPGRVVTGELLDERYARLYGDARVAAGIISGFGALAFMVAMAGIYGVMAFLVAGRTREIGIRLALGAGRRDIRRLIVGPAMAFASLGALVGVIAALVTSRWIDAHLFGVSATDPATHAAIVSAVLAMSLVAAWRPAQRAARIDPARTLRSI